MRESDYKKRRATREGVQKEKRKKKKRKFKLELESVKRDFF